MWRTEARNPLPGWPSRPPSSHRRRRDRGVPNPAGRCCLRVSTAGSEVAAVISSPVGVRPPPVTGDLGFASLSPTSVSLALWSQRSCGGVARRQGPGLTGRCDALGSEGAGLLLGVSDQPVPDLHCLTPSRWSSSMALSLSFSSGFRRLALRCRLRSIATPWGNAFAELVTRNPLLHLHRSKLGFRCSKVGF